MAQDMGKTPPHFLIFIGLILKVFCPGKVLLVIHIWDQYLMKLYRSLYRLFLELSLIEEETSETKNHNLVITDVLNFDQHIDSLDY